MFDVIYKIFTKAFQVHLQPILMDVNNQDQSTFLPFKFILNNILLTHEIISWAKRSKQSFMFLKLNFSKAYDKMNWNFLFGCMKNLVILVEFINMTKCIFKEANTCKCGSQWESF